MAGDREEDAKSGGWELEEGWGGQCASGGVKKPLRDYINKRQATVAEWVDLRPIFEVCVKEIGHEGGGRLQEPWWRQAATEQHLKATLKEISTEAWDWRRRESGRHGGGKGGEEE